MKWSGDQEAEGFQLKNYRDEQLAAKPGYNSPADAGRTIFVTTPGADYGPWIGDEITQSWVRPTGFGGSLLEPGLMMFIDPELLFEGIGGGGGPGFNPALPGALITRRAISPPINGSGEDIVLMVVTLAWEEDLIASQNPPLPFGPSTFISDFWFVSAGPILVPYMYTGNIMAHIGVRDRETGNWLDMMSILIQASGPL